ncbi:HD domain-containing protein [Pseudooceanicola sp. 502str34]
MTDDLRPRLDAQMAFLQESDRLKAVDRASTLTDQSRQENSAEHSWQAALAAMIWLGDLAPDRLSRIIAMLLLHDLVEIDAGDQPIDLPHDAVALAAAEAAAAERLFALLPADQGRAFRALWEEFEACDSPDARLAKSVDFAVPILQTWAASPRRADHEAVCRENLSTGRARLIAQTLPALFACLEAEGTASGDIARQVRFLAEMDRLKNIYRATTLGDGSRRENSAEHSWHLALYALVLGEHAGPGVDPARVVQMLLIHDIIEIDAGDAPIFGDFDAAAKEAEEAAAADRLFGLLPEAQARALRALWGEFEANETPDARFAKSVDRFQPPNQNLACGGGSWVEYSVDYATFEARVGAKIAHGAPDLFDWIAPQVRAFMATLAR